MNGAHALACLAADQLDAVLGRRLRHVPEEFDHHSTGWPVSRLAEFVVGHLVVSPAAVFLSI